MRKNMKTIILLFTCLLFSTSTLQADEKTDLEGEAKKIIKSFFKGLKNTLYKTTKAGGPTHTIEVCNKDAPGLAEKASVNGWNVGRTSLKIRNPDNKPDAWELAVLEQFEKRKADGENPKKIMYSEIIENNGVRTFRLMKAIPVAKLCLNCHGRKIKPDIKNALKKKYPEDKATGFNKGDIRGAFTLSKKL